ncbi:MAG: hypothetical protein HWE22_19380 [Flavobacteriales bacterium]|nr:hypothetical protein [Flavobacteriales bacterium]
MYKIVILIPFFVFSLIGCDSPSPSPIDNGTSKIRVESDTTIDIRNEEQNQFALERWQSYTDSLSSYFRNRVGRKMDSTWRIDTLNTEDYTLYDYRGSAMRIEVYEFDSKITATHFFNDLKTVEYIRPFGLNKRPNHILVDSNTVYWHHMEHSFGHWMNDLNNIFAEVFEFRPNSSNLDSVSGFNYCKCKNEDKELNRLNGDWIVEKPIKINAEPHQYQSGTNESSKCHFDAQDGMEISITTDSIIIDGLVHHHQVISSFRLPDNSLYWKYTFPTDTLANSYENSNLSDEFIRQTKKLRLDTSSLMHYQIDLKGWCAMSIIDIRGVGIYCFSRGMFHKMKRK